MRVSGPLPGKRPLVLSVRIYALSCGYLRRGGYTQGVAKHLVDLDEESLSAAQAELGTKTIKDTLNEALRRTTLGRRERIATALDVLAKGRLRDRSEGWR